MRRRHPRVVQGELPAEDYAGPIKVQGGEEIAKIQPTYENHYSHKFNGCFAVLDSFVSFPPHTLKSCEPTSFMT